MREALVMWPDLLCWTVLDCARWRCAGWAALN